MGERAMIWAGRMAMAIFTMFMVAASIVPKLIGATVASDTLRALGWDPRYTPMIGMIELGCLILYLVPPTSIAGATLMTGLFGGAIATQVRAGNPLFSHVLFGVYLGALMWAGLWLRMPALRAIFPFRAGVVRQCEAIGEHNRQTTTASDSSF